jgi:starch-binding outer membrane protein, SusD/RagB family
MNGRLSDRTNAAAGIAVALMLMLGLGGCDSLLEVRTPGVISSDAWDDPANAPLLVNAAIGDFECMFPVYIRSTAAISHELISSGIIGVDQNWGARRQILRNNAGGCGTAVGFYNPLQDARFLADEGYERISGFSADQVPTRERSLAKLAAYGGYTYTLLGEGMCEAPVDGGPLLSRSQLLGMAEERFTSAIGHAQASGDNSILNMAYVGRARVRLNQGNGSGAVADAQQVPEGFVRHAGRSEVAPRRYNTVMTASHEQRNWSVHPDYHNLEIDGVPDPRVELYDHGVVGTDNQTPQWSPMKYDSRSSPLPIARWEEAQLIIAEVEGGQTAVNIINDLRANVGLPGFESSDPVEIAEQVIEERRRELFLESHRLNDMIRHDLPFPTGLTHKGQPYEDATCVPIPDAERDNNPNID